jgi:hypothetical protein
MIVGSVQRRPKRHERLSVVVVIAGLDGGFRSRRVVE